MAAEAPKATSSADSYIGSLISLTSKSEIRYEGILYSINTEESSIGLRNVRSFGTEGRKKDGPQVAPSDKVYEYILFRGSDIKDLQVKSSPAQAVAPSSSSIDNDPAIIQSHYPRLVSTSTNLPPPVTASLIDVNLHSSQLGQPGSSFQGAIPLYQPGGSIGPWGPVPPPGSNGGGLTMPTYWPGFYCPPTGLPHLSQQSLLRPPPGLSVQPSVQQQMPHSGFNSSLTAGAASLPGSKLPDIPPSLLASSSSSITLTSPLPQLNLPPMPFTNLASETISSSAVPKNLNSVLSTPTFPTISPLVISAPDAVSTAPDASDKSDAVFSSSLPIITISQRASSVISSSPSHTDARTPSLLTPDQLQPIQTPTSAPSEVADKDVEVVQVSSSSYEPKVSAVKEAQPPILPLPPPSKAFHKPDNGASCHKRHSYDYRGHGRGRGRGRGRGTGGSRAVTRFTEEFDFTAMNEKFKKEEVWGELGKSSKSHLKDKEGNEALNGGDVSEDGVEEELPQIDVKPVYNKDDFFDTLSCNTLDQNSQNGRTRFSEQLKIDAETFGEFARYRGGRGGRGPGYGGRGPGYGGRGRGSYYSRGYGYGGRGRGRAVPARAS